MKRLSIVLIISILATSSAQAMDYLSVDEKRQFTKAYRQVVFAARLTHLCPDCIKTNKLSCPAPPKNPIITRRLKAAQQIMRFLACQAKQRAQNPIYTVYQYPPF
jgi:hypothetical protein